MSKHWQMLLGATLAGSNPASVATVAFARPEAHDAIKQALTQQRGPTPGHTNSLAGKCKEYELR